MRRSQTTQFNPTERTSRELELLHRAAASRIRCDATVIRNDADVPREARHELVLHYLVEKIPNGLASCVKILVLLVQCAISVPRLQFQPDKVFQFSLVFMLVVGYLQRLRG